MQVSQILMPADGEIAIALTGDFVKIEDVPSGNLLTITTRGAAPTATGDGAGNTTETQNENESFVGSTGRSIKFENEFQKLEISGAAGGEVITLQTGFGWILDSETVGTPTPPLFAPYPPDLIGNVMMPPNSNAYFTGINVGLPSIPGFINALLEVSGPGDPWTGPLAVLGSINGGAWSGGSGTPIDMYDVNGNLLGNNINTPSQVRINISGYNELYFENADATNSLQVNISLSMGRTGN